MLHPNHNTPKMVMKTNLLSNFSINQKLTELKIVFIYQQNYFYTYTGKNSEILSMFLVIINRSQPWFKQKIDVLADFRCLTKLLRRWKESALENRMGQERQAAGMRAQSGLVRYPCSLNTRSTAHGACSHQHKHEALKAAATPARAAPGD